MERLGLPEDPVAAAFREAADAWKHEEFDTRYEPLGLITADGRYIDYARSPWDRLLPEFASAAARLERRGELSPVVETEMELQDGKHLRGFHVIVLLERTPPLKLDEQEWRAALTPEIHQARALRAQKELMDSLRGAARIAIERNVDAHLAALPAPSK